MMSLWNSAAHYGIGAWCGYAVNEPEYRHGAYILASGFLAYQGIGAWRKGDLGFPEIKEFLVGVAGALAYRRWQALPEDRRVEILDTLEKSARSVTNEWLG